MCICGCAGQAVSSPSVLVMEEKTSLYGTQDVNCALPGVHSLPASLGKAALCPGGAERCKTGLNPSLCTITAPLWERDLGSSPLAVCVMGKAGG